MNRLPWIKKLFIGSDIRWTAIRALGLIIFFGLLFTKVLLPIRVQTESMEPNVSLGQWIWASKVHYRFSEVQRGDVVLIQLGRGSVNHLARIVALPGDQFAVVDGQIYVNREPLENSNFQVDGAIVQDFYSEITLEPDEVFVLGDNRNRNLEWLHSEGAFGRVDLSRIAGKVLFQ